jgi:cytosine permease
MLMVYGHILELVEHWISMLGVMLSAISGVIIIEYYITGPKLARLGHDPAAHRPRGGPRTA